MWVITVDERQSDDDLAATIAHEIAHAWLGHDQSESAADGGAQEERDAAMKAREWGFSGRATDPDWATRHSPAHEPDTQADEPTEEPTAADRSSSRRR